MRTFANRLFDLHWALLATVLAICLIGVYNLQSAAAERDPSLYLTQLLWVGMGLVLVVAALTFDYRVTEGAAYIAYAVMCVLLLAVLVRGDAAMGARRWLVIGPVRFQPSEIAKIAVVLCLARYFSSRLRPEGYSLRDLTRPLNPSRPLALAVLVAIGWDKAWMTDPVGEVARLLRKKLSVAPVLDDLMWFRVFAIIFVFLAAAVAVLLILRLEAQQALLNPWPPTRRRRLILTILGGSIASLVGVGLAWDAAAMRDPFGLALRSLYEAAGPGGSMAKLEEGLGMRLFMLTFVILHGLASVWSLRGGVNSLVDVLIAPLDLLLVPFVLVLVEPDLGTAGIIMLAGMSMILIVGVRLRSLIVMGFLGSVVAAVSWFGVLKDYQKRRIITFLDPEHDLQGAGWHAVQSMIAVGSGRWFGQGHGEGTQTQLAFLPEQHTDFAFSVWAEETGFLGCLAVLLLYLLLIWFALGIARTARDTYGVLLTVGLTAIIVWQTFINASMISGAFPVVGITMPLFSYGGTSLLSIMLCVGLLLNVHWRRRAY